MRNVISFLKEHYKTDKVTLIGHSWGGGLAAL
ncbi:alpha/beta fold hydrolase [Microbulbifer sp. MLAF003]